MATAAAAGQLVSNHSYGVAAGGIPIGGAPPDNWWWIGGPDPSDLEDANFGHYDTESQLWDQIARDAPYFLIVKAAGNDRFDLGPEPGEEYTIIDQEGNPVTTSTVPRPPDCSAGRLRLPADACRREEHSDRRCRWRPARRLPAPWRAGAGDDDAVQRLGPDRRRPH
jgi:hypothetical protein